MIELNGQIDEMLQEIRQIISSVPAVKSIQEELNITYFAEVETEDDKQNIENLGSYLSTEARNYGFDLEIIPVTRNEIEQAKTKLEDHYNEVALDSSNN